MQKLHAIHSIAQTSIGIDAAAESVSVELHLLVQRIRLNAEQIEKTEDILVSLVNSIGDSQYLLSIRGLSYITVAGLLAELGPLSYYQNAGQLIKMAGTNPTESESAGKRGSRTPMSKKGRPVLRYCAWTSVIPMLRLNSDFRAWAKKMRERPVHANPLNGREVVGAGLNRLLRLSFALVKKQTFYRVLEPARTTW